VLCHVPGDKAAGKRRIAVIAVDVQAVAAVAADIADGVQGPVQAPVGAKIDAAGGHKCFRGNVKVGVSIADEKESNSRRRGLVEPDHQDIIGFQGAVIGLRSSCTVRVGRFH
jgi:hypothetical protein